MSRWLVASPLNDWSKEKEHKKFRAQLKREGGHALEGRKLPLFSRVVLLSRALRLSRAACARHAVY